MTLTVRRPRRRAGRRSHAPRGAPHHAVTSGEAAEAPIILAGERAVFGICFFSSHPFVESTTCGAVRATARRAAPHHAVTSGEAAEAPLILAGKRFVSIAQMPFVAKRFVSSIARSHSRSRRLKRIQLGRQSCSRVSRLPAGGGWRLRPVSRASPARFPRHACAARPRSPACPQS